MRKPGFLLFVMMFMLFNTYAQTTTFEKLSDGVLVHLAAGPTKAVRLQVISDKIIHVMASPLDRVKDDTSLMVTGTKGAPGQWSLITANDNLVLSTASLKVVVSLKSGVIHFTGLRGNLLLQEENYGRSFIPVTIDGGPSQQINQAFYSPPGEAFYGLGQHQQGLMNYKHQLVQLLQNNTEVAVPFLMSNKNYGILWENYSITQFGDGRFYQPLSKLRLFDKNGIAGGLTANYGSKKDPSQPVIERTEDAIDYDYLPSLVNFPSSFKPGEGIVTWQGWLQSSLTGLHQFSIKYGGYIKVWIDGKLVLDRWRQCWNPATAVVGVNFQPQKKIAIKIEWVPDGGESFIACNWLAPCTPAQGKRFTLSSEAADNINYYFVYGKDMDEVISGYRQLTGKAPIPPKWALGFWQSRERYKTSAEVLSVIRTFRQQQVPVDNIVLDWQYWKPDQWGSQEFDTTRFPDPVGMIDSLHNVFNAHLMISVWPKFYKDTKNFDLLNSQGWLYTKNIQDNRKDWLGYVSTFYDAFNPAAGRAFWQLVRDNLYTKGIDAWWMDAPEPDIHSNFSIGQRKQLMFPNALGSATRYFNAYPLANARTIYEGQRSVNPGKRVFILTRSAYGGLQRYGAAVWSGDIASRWHDMKDQVAAGVNFSMSGIPYWTMDIGGFAVEHRFENARGPDLAEWKELMTRWYQFGAFCPLFRVHGQYPYREIFNISTPGDTAYQSMLYYDKLRYRLMPYLYSIAAKTYIDDYSIMRGLPMDFAGDKNVTSINDQYLFGPSLLINPVCNYEQRNRKVYLPAGSGWFDLYSANFFEGGRNILAKAPYDRMPVFVKEGSIIPFGPALQYTGERAADTITLNVYTGKNASFSLYEDEDTNYNYEQGRSAIIKMDYNENTKKLTIHDRGGQFAGMLQKRVFRIVWISKSRPLALVFDQRGEEVVYDGKQVIVKMK